MSWSTGSFKVKIVTNKRGRINYEYKSIILWWLTRYNEKFLCLQQNMRDWVTCTPPTSWKVCRRNVEYIIFATNKTKKMHIISIICAPVVTQFIVKYKENRKKSDTNNFLIFLQIVQRSVSKWLFSTSTQCFRHPISAKGCIDECLCVLSRFWWPLLHYKKLV